MSSETALVAHQYRLNQWAQEVRDCNNRPENQSVTSWCRENNLKPSNFYYHLNQVRKACLDLIPANEEQVEPKPISQSVVPVPQTLIANANIPPEATSSITIKTNNLEIQVSEGTTAELLQMVLGVVCHVE